MTDYTSLLEEMLASKAAQEEKVAKCEENELWGMAYLSEWVILENTIKNIFVAHRKYNLLRQINAWKMYLEGESKNPPNKITDFTVDITRIPNITDIEKIIGKAKNIREILKPRGKWRRMRNKAAHTTEEEFGMEKTYLEYKQEVKRALDELEILLRRKAQ